MYVYFWIIYEIKMKNCALLSSNLPSVIDRHIYHRAAKRRGDKFDQLMTRGKLLDNNAQFFIFYFYSNNNPTSPKGPRKQTTEPILRTAILGKTVTTGWMGKRGLAYCQLGFIRK